MFWIHWWCQLQELDIVSIISNVWTLIFLGGIKKNQCSHVSPFVKMLDEHFWWNIWMSWGLSKLRQVNEYENVLSKSIAVHRLIVNAFHSGFPLYITRCFSSLDNLDN